MILTITEMEDILSYLPGWRLETAKPLIQKEHVGINPFLGDDEITDLNTNFSIKPEEVERAYTQTLSIVESWLGVGPLPSPRTGLETGIRMWTAGRLYGKHNIRLNENVDEGGNLNYGDKLVVEAKELLKPFRFRLSFI